MNHNLQVKTIVLTNNALLPTEIIFSDGTDRIEIKRDLVRDHYQPADFMTHTLYRVLISRQNSRVDIEFNLPTQPHTTPGMCSFSDCWFDNLDVSDAFETGAVKIVLARVFRQLVAMEELDAAMLLLDTGYFDNEYTDTVEVLITPCDLGDNTPFAPVDPNHTLRIRYQVKGSLVRIQRRTMVTQLDPDTRLTKVLRTKFRLEMDEFELRPEQRVAEAVMAWRSNPINGASQFASSFIPPFGGAHYGYGPLPTNGRFEQHLIQPRQNGKPEVTRSKATPSCYDGGTEDRALKQVLRALGFNDRGFNVRPIYSITDVPLTGVITLLPAELDVILRNSDSGNAAVFQHRLKDIGIESQVGLHNGYTAVQINNIAIIFKPDELAVEETTPTAASVVENIGEAVTVLRHAENQFVSQLFQFSLIESGLFKINEGTEPLEVLQLPLDVRSKWEAIGVPYSADTIANLLRRSGLEVTITKHAGFPAVQFANIILVCNHVVV